LSAARYQSQLMKLIKLSKEAGISIIILVALLSISCSARISFQRGENAFKNKNWDIAVEEYLKAVQSDPQNPRYRLSLASALMEASYAHSERGEKFFNSKDYQLALIEFQKALEYYPENIRSKKGKLEVLKILEQERIAGEEKTKIEEIKEKAKYLRPEFPNLGPASATLLSLKFSNDTELSQIFSSLQKLSGITILFDEAFRSKKISIDLENVTFKDALEKLLLVSGLFYKVLDEQTILIIPDTQAKRKEYEELILKTFYISNGDVNQIQGMLRTLAEINVIAVNPNLNTIIVRESPQKVGIAEKIIASQDKSNAELLIDVEILEVNRTRMREYGIELSNYYVTQYLAPGSSSLNTSSSLVRGHMFYSINSSDFLFSLPSVSYRLLETDAKSKVVAKPQLRVVDGETVSVRLGDKVPLPMTTFVPIAAGGPSQQAITSYQLYDVGINMDLTPRVHHNGDITLKMKFELSFITTPGTATMPPTIGNRTVTTIIRLKDNETGLLAGLLRDSERKTWGGLPALRDIPILNWIFGKTRNEIEQTDIVLTLTPRIIRMPDISEEDLASLWVGTEKNIGLKGSSAQPPPGGAKIEKEPERPEKSDQEPIKKAIAQEPSYQKVALSFFPPSTDVPSNTDFSVQAYVKNAENVASLILSLKFDPDLMQVKEVKEGDLMNKDGARTSFYRNVNNTSGIIQIGITREGHKKGASGEGELFSIIFTPKKKGDSNIEVTSSTFWDPEMYKIPIDSVAGKISIK
jgi:general secretion pathway protein D